MTRYYYFVMRGVSDMGTFGVFDLYYFGLVVRMFRDGWLVVYLLRIWVGDDWSVGLCFLLACFRMP